MGRNCCCRSPPGSGTSISTSSCRSGSNLPKKLRPAGSGRLLILLPASNSCTVRFRTWACQHSTSELLGCSQKLVHSKCRAMEGGTAVTSGFVKASGPICRVTGLMTDLTARLERGEILYLHCWGGRGRAGKFESCIVVSQTSSQLRDQLLANAWFQNCVPAFQ